MPLYGEGEQLGSSDPAYWWLWNECLSELGFTTKPKGAWALPALDLNLSTQDSLTVFVKFLQRECDEMGGDHALDIQPLLSYMQCERDTALSEFERLLTAVQSEGYKPS